MVGVNWMKMVTIYRKVVLHAHYGILNQLSTFGKKMVDDFECIKREYESYHIGVCDERHRVLEILKEETFSEHGVTLIGDEVRRRILNKIHRRN